MYSFKLGEMEEKFAYIMWENAPVSSRRLKELCEEEFGCKQSTTYTILKSLYQRGIFENNKGTLISLMSIGDFKSMQSEEFLTENLS